MYIQRSGGEVAGDKYYRTLYIIIIIIIIIEIGTAVVKIIVNNDYCRGHFTAVTPERK